MALVSTQRWQTLSHDEKHLLERYSNDSGEYISNTEFAQRASLRDLKPVSKISMMLLGLLFVGSVATNIVLLHQKQSMNLDEICTRHTTITWSPVLEKPMTYSDIRFNGSLFKSDIYRSPPSPEVDQAWKDLGLNLRPQVVEDSQAEKAGIMPFQAKRLKSQGGGYFVEVEAIHHLHCLNVLRQNVWFNADYYRQRKMGVWANTEPVVRLHVGHCVNILRQQLMCTADTALFGQMWVNSTALRTFADFSTHHKCKNFDLVRSWAMMHQSKETDVAEYHEGDLVIDKYP